MHLSYCTDKITEVFCNDKHIRVKLDTNYFNSSKYENITFRDKTCKALVSNNSISLVSTLNGCGATMNATSDEIAYENEVVLRINASENGKMLRDHTHSIPVRCVYKRSQIAEVATDGRMENETYRLPVESIGVVYVLFFFIKQIYIILQISLSGFDLELRLEKLTRTILKARKF